MSRRAKRAAIIGGGLAGITCALRLSELDPALGVTLYEQDEIGGTSAFAVGSFTAAGTKWQRNAGITDTPAGHFATLLELCEFDGDERDVERYHALLRACCDVASETLERLASWGLFFAGPFLEPPHPKPRMHNVISSGAAMMALLRLRLDATTVAVREHFSVDGIARRDDAFEVAGDTYDAVVVACGDRSARTGSIEPRNPRAIGGPIDMVELLCGAKRHRPQYTAGLRAVAAGSPSIAPDPVFLAACDVVADGVPVPGQRVMEEPAQFAGRDLFLKVTDAERFMREPVSTYPAIGYATLADILPTTLVAKREPLLLGPFRVVVSFVDAGLDVDSAMRVLDANAAPVAGLYACGSAGVGGMRLEGHGHHLLWAAHSGLMAAGAIALAE